MTDNTRVNELQDKLLKAMDILNAQALNSISFDKTIVCTIVNDENKKEGKYEVNDGNRIFVAYSSDTGLRSGDVVYVTIPQGKFENQKMIIGKKTTENDKPFVFQTPFDTYFDMTDNIVANTTISSLTANTLDKYGEDKNYEIKSIIEKSGLSHSNYTRLAIKADFRSWIKDAVRGDYGLLIVIKTKEPDAVGKPDKESTYSFIFNNSDMYGNTYNFETYYSQEMVIPIDNIKGIITDIKVSFYQEANFFDQFNEPIRCSEGGYKTIDGTNQYALDADGDYQIKENDVIFAPNLFVDNLYIGLGYDISIFGTDYVEIYTQDRSTYRRSVNTDRDDTAVANQKVIKTRWVHLKDGIPIDMSKGDNKPGIKYEVRWYRYCVGAAAADEYCGVYWENASLDTERVSIANNGFICTFQPNVNKQQEKIKVIIVEKDAEDKIIAAYKGNELIFENEEDLPPSQEAQHIANALLIIPDDGLDGNYMLYGQDDNIKDISYANEIRTLSCKFDANGDGIAESEVDQGNLIWYFPTENSMIKLLNGDSEKPSMVTGNQPQYEIASYCTPSNSNNTIQCQYTLNGAVYTSEIEFTFGAAGTMGSDQTLVIDFEGDKKAIKQGEQTASFQVRLYDNQNKLQNIPNGTVHWAWYYHSDQSNAGFEKVLIENGNATYTFQNYSFSIEKLYILQATVENLTAYFSIPIKNSNDYSYIKGPTQVIYQSNGEPSYNRDKYELYDINGDIVSVDKWQIKSTDKKPESDSNYKLGRYDAGLSTDYRLKPIECYVNEAPIYGVQALGANDTILWTQPILVLQNRWGSNVINKWDGKSIEMNESLGTILTTAIAAGKKESDNSFTGVMAGSWGRTDTNKSITEHTGIYGFHHGTISYALKDDGTAFFGKDGQGRINIDGNKATIYSETYNSKNHGIKIDLNDPYIVLSNTYGQNSIAQEDTGTYPFQVGSNFQIEWDGTIHATDGEFSGHIEADSGTIGSWNIGDYKVGDTTYNNSLYSDDGNIILSPENDGTILLRGTNSMISGGIIHGSIVRAGILQSNSTNNITLQGYLTIDTTNGNDGGTGALMGRINSGLSGAPGIGFRYAPGNDNIRGGEIKATASNVGMRYGASGGSGYIFITSTTPNFSNHLNKNTITIGGTEGNENYLVIQNIPAANQTGIYARFA